jgi:hypothetical protein
MRLVRLVLLAATVGASGCACAKHTARAPSPETLLAGAIEQAGGADALARARALTWAGTATVHAGGRTVHIAGRWSVQPPDTAVVATYDVSRGPATTRALVVAAPRGWVVAGGRFDPMPPPLLANERDEFYLYDVMRLVPLRAPGVRLTTVPADTLGQPGFRAEQAGRPAVELHVDAGGRLAHLRTQVRDPGGGAPVWQDVWLAGVVEADGVRWPRELRLTMNGAPYFALAIDSLRTAARLDDARLAGPR